MTSGGELAHAKLIQGICIWLGFIFLLREMLRFLVYICSLNLVLTYLTPSAVGLAWDATRGGGGRGHRSDRPAATRPNECVLT